MSRLIGTKTQLRALEPQDLDILYQWENQEEIWYLGQTLVPFSKDLLIKYLDNAHLDLFSTKQLRLVIETKSPDSIPIGFIDLFDFDPQHQRAGVGILIGHSEWRNQGYGRDALKSLCRYAFETLLLNQLYCSILEQNTASIKLFEDLGFEKTGVRKNWIKTHQGFQHVGFYQLDQETWSSSCS